MSENREKLGELIRAHREAHGWTTRELARRTSLGESTIRQIENVTGDSSPRPITLEILAKAFGLTPNAFSGVLDGTRQVEMPVMVVDNATLLSSMVAVRESVDELRERQDKAEAINLERHRTLEQHLGDIRAMLNRLNPKFNPDATYGQGPDVDIKPDDGQQPIS